MNQILYPPDIVEVTRPVIFLNGPIQGTDDWQAVAASIIHSIDENIIVANPRRIKLDKYFTYEEQVDWETHYRKIARDNGGVNLFFLANETNHLCRRAFAQTSRFELGEAMVWNRIYQNNNSGRLVVAIASKFTNKRYIIRRLTQEVPESSIFFCEEGSEQCDCLRQACLKAVTLCG